MIINIRFLQRDTGEMYLQNTVPDGLIINSTNEFMSDSTNEVYYKW